jgi:hypothetical protein
LPDDGSLSVPMIVPPIIQCIISGNPDIAYRLLQQIEWEFH